MDTKTLKKDIEESLILIKEYNWLLDSYVLNFFVDDHWKKLPNSWQTCFTQITSQNLAFLVNLNETTTCTIWPLSILSLRALLRKLTICRKSENIEVTDSVFTHPKLQNIFKKHVKPKKRHEVEIMSEICSRTAKKCDVKYIVDFGAGLGHLSRKLAYAHGLNVCCLEQQTELTKQASIIDMQLEVTAERFLHSSDFKTFHRPVHLNMKLTADIQVDDFIDNLKHAFNYNSSDKFKFGIVGLHPCGDLAAILLRIFSESNEAMFINIVGCCYMKLTTNNEDNGFNGFPLSKFVTERIPRTTNLTYESREIACHAIEMYHKRLIDENYENLKIHSYRAAIESIIIKHYPHLKRIGLKSVKHTANLTFKDYCHIATNGLNIDLPAEDVDSIVITKMLENWKNVVIFYSLRLMFAPLIESVILMDRVISIREKGFYCDIRPYFNPILSPRNHITTAMKENI